MSSQESKEMEQNCLYARNDLEARDFDIACPARQEACCVTLVPATEQVPEYYRVDCCERRSEMADRSLRTRISNYLEARDDDADLAYFVGSPLKTE